ncbi:MAG: hypothetical protein WD016_05190 [Balneolaceae bacterium]
MSIKITNRKKEKIEVGGSIKWPPTSIPYQPLDRGQMEPLKTDTEYMVLLVPNGLQFKFKVSNDLVVEFIQVKPRDSNHQHKDTYVFRLHDALKADDEMPSGDIEVEDPDDDEPPFIGNGN